MIVLPLSIHSRTAVRDALLARGWEGELADLSAGGIDRVAFLIDGLSIDEQEAMVPVAGRLGLEIITGPGWLLLAGVRSRVGAFARPWLQPERLQPLATAIGMRLPAALPTAWRHRSGTMELGGPSIAGVINLTPDSFSSSSRASSIDEALTLADAMLAGGAHLLEVGGESTRPGADPVGPEVEAARVMPVLEALVVRFPDVPVAIDTVRATTARRAVDSGASIVNDVTAGRHDPEILAVAGGAGAGLILSHSRGPLHTIASDSHIDEGEDIVTAVVRELDSAALAAVAAGCGSDTIVIDPGFGFGKSAAQNFRLLRGLDALTALGYPVMAALSRKRFLGTATGREVEDRDRATAAASALAYAGGARIFRVHHPEAVRDALAVAAAMEAA